jgi:hypothetical protein
MFDDRTSGARSSNPRPAEPWRRITPRFQAMLLVYSLAAGAYAIYVSITESGLAGYMMQLQMATLGEAMFKLTMLLTIVALIMPLLAIWAILEKLAPSLVWSYATGQEPGPIERMNAPLQSLSWRAVFIGAAIPIMIGAVLFAVLDYRGWRDQREKVYAVDLTSNTGNNLSRNARFVELTGLMARSYALMFKNGQSGSISYELFAPITGTAWTAGDPVLYFVHYESPMEYTGATAASADEVAWPDAFRHRGAARFSGRIGTSLPGFVERKFRSKGLSISPSYSVVEWQDLSNRRVPPSSSAIIAGGICFGVAVLTFAMMAFIKFNLAYRKRQRQKAAFR